MGKAVGEIAEQSLFRHIHRLSDAIDQHVGAAELQSDLQAGATRPGELTGRARREQNQDLRCLPRSCATVPNRATRSAHIARPRDTFSTSAPGTKASRSVTTIAPMCEARVGSIRASERRFRATQRPLRHATVFVFHGFGSYTKLVERREKLRVVSLGRERCRRRRGRGEGRGESGRSRSRGRAVGSDSHSHVPSRRGRTSIA